MIYVVFDSLLACIMRTHYTALIVALLATGCSSRFAPSDAKLISDFHTNQELFAELSQLGERYPSLSRVTQEPRSWAQASANGLQTKTVNDYVDLLRRTNSNRLLWGIAELNARTLFITYDSCCVGLAGGPTELMGVALDPDSPVPQVTDLTAWRAGADTPAYLELAYKPLGGGWFAFRLLN